ncbi:MAG: hypothetical protein QF893_22910 [Alphaproteobacteria bacterium]|jgi:hypothetical protein|nr:hypothetical protein [Alphaproteobacteria bacterium]
MTGDPTLSRWRAATRLHHDYFTGLLLYLLQTRGEAAGSELIFRIFRRQHEEKFLAGLKTLGLDSLPPAVACAQFIYLANLVGGVKVEVMPESEHKAWVRYPPPRWAYMGPSICAVPRETSVAFMRAFHSRCGVTLGNPRLGFVCTAITTDGDPGLEGYFVEEDRDLAEDERLRFRPDETGPDFDPALAPKLDWDESRLIKARRNYAIQYIRMALPALADIFGEAEGAELGRHAARLVGMQAYDETAGLLCIEARDAPAFATYLQAMLDGGGDEAEVSTRGTDVIVEAPCLRILEADGPGSAQTRFQAWNGLFEGALAVHNRHLTLKAVSDDDAWRWRIEAR